MGIFGAMKNALSGVTRTVSKEYGGNKDFLEAVCAASAMVAAADGDIIDEEIAAAAEATSSNPTLGSLYDTSTIEQTMTAMCKRAKSASGRIQLLRELDDVKNRQGTQQMREDIYLVAYDVAAASGDVDAKEQAVLSKLAQRLGVDGARLVG